jgi:uncharacterized protein (TIGR02231 family)
MTDVAPDALPTQDRLDAPIVEVTVFQDGARVVRRGTVDLEAGMRTVVLDRLPVTLDGSSARVVARGTGIALRDVEVSRSFESDPAHGDTQRLRDELEEARSRLQAILDEDAAERARLRFLKQLSGAAATAFARAVGFGRAEHGELARMGDELASGTAAALARRREIAARRRRAEREVDAAERALGAAEAPERLSVTLVAVRATLEVTAPTTAELEVSYHVTGASWEPLYDLRLHGEKLALDYLAEVSQRSGEDWPAVPLALSTTRRGRHTELPELSPWYIGRVTPAAPAARRARRMAPMEEASPVGGSPPPGGTLAPRQVFAAAPAAAYAEAAPLVAHAEESGAAMVYRVPVPMAVPSDGAARKTTVARFELDAALDHLAVPALAQEAYLRATVTNTSEVLLLPGPANVFHEDEFVGRTRVGTVAPGEELELELGVDDRVRVERELRRRTTSKAMLGGNRSVDVAYEITVENHRAVAARVTVQDHFPVSRDGDVKVRLREALPKADEQDELGQLTWKLVLEPGGKSPVRFAFTVEHPAGATLFGL